jgi:glycosyltransferase involved in cell wall biosynthesis
MYFALPMTTVDIVLPAFNPLPGWEENVITRYSSLQRQLPDIQFQLYIVNDGSSKLDENLSKFRLQEKIPDVHWISYQANRGKGYALRQGVSETTAEFIVYTDIDWPYEETSMLGMIHILRNTADAVIGIRNTNYYNHLPPARRRISRLLRSFNAKLLRLKVDDTQAGLKGFRKHLKDDFLQTTIDRYLFDLEFIYLLSRKKNVNIVGFPISLRSGITFSKMNRKILFQEAGNFIKIWLRP